MDQSISFNDLQEELKSHDFKLVTFNNDELRIKGISGISPFVIVVMSFLGICLVSFGLVSLFVIQKPEYVAGTLLVLAGIVLVILPFYNYYSRSYFEVKFRKPDKSVLIKHFDPLPNKQLLKFDDIASFHLLKNTLNAYVDDTSKGSYIYSYSISMKLKNNDKMGIIQFSKRDQKIESFSVNFADILVNITGIPKEFEVAS